MEFDSSKGEESDYSLQNRLAHPDKRGCEGGTDCGTEELGESEDTAWQHQDDQGGNESILYGIFILFW